ncbi:hypothetical protein CPB83DRAFT_836456 [Crepidotus variabilis]|uniref:Uncharacterized protein n=1 Tax=Crepidotus variabilis TaxID=179855 RepID=A0A9P6EEP4_9AGAR|nr:hypothetical protein CPB83DRAFT_836456 [Crepidotus variabilis]
MAELMNRQSLTLGVSVLVALSAVSTEISMDGVKMKRRISKPSRRHLQMGIPSSVTLMRGDLGIVDKVPLGAGPGRSVGIAAQTWIHLHEWVPKREKMQASRERRPQVDVLVLFGRSGRWGLVLGHADDE